MQLGLSLCCSRQFHRAATVGWLYCITGAAGVCMTSSGEGTQPQILQSLRLTSSPDIGVFRSWGAGKGRPWTWNALFDSFVSPRHLRPICFLYCITRFTSQLSVMVFVAAVKRQDQDHLVLLLVSLMLLCCP